MKTDQISKSWDRFILYVYFLEAKKFPNVFTEDAGFWMSLAASPANGDGASLRSPLSTQKKREGDGHTHGQTKWILV